jgi:prepilin-type processing-associated H-X9-DG protein
MYRSNVTGGDSLYSMVGLVSLKNAAGMKQSLKTLAGHLDQRVAPMADGHVRFVNWTQGDVDMLTVTFPGLPIPVQLTLGVADDHLIAGLMPEAVQAAATQLGAATCVLDNPAYAKVRPHAKQQMIRIQFTDTAQRIPGGYGLTSALMAAIGNYARPKGHVAGGIAAVMPSFTDLMSGASSCIFVQRMEGDDLVIEGSTDRSVISGMTAMVGELSSSPILLGALAAGVLLPALSKARVAARSMQEKATLQSALMACHAYAEAHDGKLPPSLSSLVKGGYVDADQIQGMTYYPYAEKISSLRAPSDHVILTGDDWNEGVNVAFADGHVANVTYNRIETLLKETEEVNQKAQE